MFKTTSSARCAFPLLAGFLLTNPALAGAPTLASQVEVAGAPLVLVGHAIQRVFLFNIYEIGLYLGSPAHDADAVLSVDQPKQLRIRMLQGAKRKQVVDALKDGFVRGNRYGADLSALKERLDLLLAAVSDVRAGDELVITYVPGQGTALESSGGSRMQVPGKDFSDALLKVWLGDDPGARRIKRELLGA
jgi:hypothetical protein